MRGHEGTHKLHQCDICIKEFILYSHVKKHIECVHLKLKYVKCEICFKDFYKKTELQPHIRNKHTGDQKVPRRPKALITEKKKRKPRVRKTDGERKRQPRRPRVVKKRRSSPFRRNFTSPIHLFLIFNVRIFEI